MNRNGLTPLLTTLAVIILTGCGSSAKSADSGLKFTQSNVTQLTGATDDKDIKGAKVTNLVGKVFSIQRGDGQTAAQVYTDPETSGGNLIVIAPDTAPGVSGLTENEFIQFSGTVIDLFTGTNAFGAELQVPRISAPLGFKKVDAALLDPPITSNTRRQTKTLPGPVYITVSSTEASAKQTRIKIRIRNSGSEDYYSSPTLTANGEQIETDYSTDYKEPSSSVSAGASTSGTLVFKPVPPRATLKLTFDGTDADYNTVNVAFVIRLTPTAPTR